MDPANPSDPAPAPALVADSTPATASGEDHPTGFTEGAGAVPRLTVRARGEVLVLLLATAVLYTWNIAVSGWANQYYAAAVQAGTQSWTAMLFGSLDAGNAITVDKPPASLWLMALSGRIFGFSSWSMLVPQAVCGVLTVALLYGAVRRWSGHRAGLLAGALFAITPVATLMFRFNNPDALLTVLLVASGYAVVRAMEKASPWWLAGAGTAIGFAFLTKMMQAFLIVPVLAVVYLVAAPTSVRRRLLHLLAAGGAVLVSAGWWVALVMLVPASARPYVGGSSNNNIVDLIVSGNGLDRLFGHTAPNVSAPGDAGVAGGTITAFGGPAGWARMFQESFGAQVSWLLPAALIGLVAGLWLRGRAPRTDRIRASLLLWGGWMLVTAAVFSFMGGVVHSYYSVALAPGIVAVLAVSVRELWRARERWPARIVLVVMVVATGAWSWVLLGRASSWHPELRWIVLLVTAVAVVLGIAGLLAPATGNAVARRVSFAVAGVAAVLVAAVPSAAYSLQTAGSSHSGSIPTAGPGESLGGPGEGPGGVTMAKRPGPAGPGTAGDGPGRPPFTGEGIVPPEGGMVPEGPPSGGLPERPYASDGFAESADDTEIVALLQRTGATWAAAVVGAQSAASLELSSGKSVIAVGGFSGRDGGPTPLNFQRWVAEGKVRYFLTADSSSARSRTMGGGAPGPSTSGGRESVGTTITDWVEEHYPSTTVGTWTVYDLTAAQS